VSRGRRRRSTSATGRRAEGDELVVRWRNVDDERAALDRLLGTVCRRDREVLRLRFAEDLTQRGS
jgi:hypothetical protein